MDVAAGYRLAEWLARGALDGCLLLRLLLLLFLLLLLLGL